jgi:hypothetical protein
MNHGHFHGHGNRKELKTMTLKEFANVDSFYRDLDSGRELKYHEYMNRIITHLGLQNIKQYIPFSIDYLKVKLEDDYNFNNTKMISWDRAAGFITRKGDVMYLGGGITDLFFQNGITTFSCAEGVSVLKNAARMLCEKKGNNE